MLNENTWRIFKSLKRRSKRRIIVLSRTDFLYNCKKEKLIPQGMRYKPKIKFKTDHDNHKYLNKLSITSRSTLQMAYKSFTKEKKILEEKIQQDMRDLRISPSEEEYRNVQDKINKNNKYVERKMINTKSKKLHNLRLKYCKDSTSDINHNEDEENNLRSEKKRNRWNINNKRNRSSKAKRMKRKENIMMKEQHLIDKLQNIDMPSEDRFKPYDNTNYDMNVIEQQLCAKGLKFVPSVKRVDRHQKELDFESFARVLRLGLYFHRRGNWNEQEQHPWTPRSNWDPPHNMNEKLEEYLEEVHNDLFSLENIRKVPDNMTSMQREALRNLSKWNHDETNPRMFRVQDKGARLFIEWKERYRSKVEDYLEDTRIFREKDHDMSQENKDKVIAWTNKWHDKEVINEEEI